MHFMSTEPVPPATEPLADPSEEEVNASLPKGRACRCGHDRTSHMVSPSGEYTFLGWCLILVGISANPTAIRWSCRRCQEQVYRTTDPEIIKRTRLFG